MAGLRAVTDPASRPPTRAEALRFWLKLGFISFGGPAGQIAILHEEVVERRRWISEARFLHALNFCMMLPGPEATQLVTYIGWLLHRTWGGVIAGALFVLPSALLLWGLSVVYVTWGNLAWVAAVFAGLKPAVLGIIAAALLRIAGRALNSVALWILAGAAFVALFVFRTPFPLVIGGAAMAGWLGGRFWPAQFKPPAVSGGAPALLDDADAPPAHARPSLARSLKIIAVCGALWWLPVIALGAWLGWGHALFREGVFFSKAAMVTFGGAYAVLPYVSQQAVEAHGWLSAGQMLDGLALAETTPGPLIMVLQFVGFLGGWNHPGPLSPLAAASLGAFITTWTTFVPCFLWILAGAPYVEHWRGRTALNAALAAVTAAVAGVIFNLAVWFGQHVLFPAGHPFDLFAAFVATGTFLALWRWKCPIHGVVLGAGVLGLARMWLS